MRKSIMLAPAASARTMVPNEDTARMLASGSWVIVQRPKKRTRDAEGMDRMRERRREAGYRDIRVTVPKEVFEALHAVKHESESLGQLLARLVRYVSTEST